MFNSTVEELLGAIDDKIASIENLAKEGKYKEANAASEELKEMQKSLENLQGIHDKTPAPKNPKIVKPVVPKTQDTVEAKFADAARHGFRNVMTEGVPADGGYTVPEDIQTKINKLREATFNLAQLVSQESVSTETGSRTYQKKHKKVGFSKIGEKGHVTATEQPEFFRLSYSIAKYGGFIPVTSELLNDSDANITNVITEWLADESRVTRNKLVIDALERGKGKTDANDPKRTAFKNIAGITKILNVTLGSAYKGTSKIITNDYGLQLLSELTDANGRALLNPNPSDPMKMQLAAGATVVPVEVIPANELENVTVKTKSFAPFIIGDLKEGATLFMRKQMQIKSSDVASVTGMSAFEDDCVLFRGLERLDVEPKDTDAYVLAYFDKEIVADTEVAA